jgi:hypothetical protein
MRSYTKIHVGLSSLSNLDDRKEDDLDAWTKGMEICRTKLYHHRLSHSYSRPMCRSAYIIARKRGNMVSHLPGDKMTRFKGQQRNDAEVHLR